MWPWLIVVLFLIPSMSLTAFFMIMTFWGPMQAIKAGHAIREAEARGEEAEFVKVCQRDSIWPFGRPRDHYAEIEVRFGWAAGITSFLLALIWLAWTVILTGAMISLKW